MSLWTQLTLLLKLEATLSVVDNGPYVSIITVTYNSESVIREFLDSLSATVKTLGLDAETIIVDNASRDGTAETLRDLNRYTNLHIRLVLNRKNIGLSKAMNDALNLSRGRKILICNPDIVFTDSIGEMFKISERIPALILVPQLYAVNGQLQEIIHRRFPTIISFISEVTTLRVPILSRMIARNIRYVSREYRRPLDTIEHMSAVCMLVDRRVARRLVPFYDPAFPVYWNDVDMSKRAANLGIRCAIVLDAKVYHELGHSVARSDPEMIAMLRYSSLGVMGYARRWNMHPNLIHAALFLDATLRIAREIPKRYLGRRTHKERRQGRLPTIQEAARRYILPFRCSLR